MSSTSTSWEETRCSRRSMGPSKVGVETAYVTPRRYRTSPPVPRTPRRPSPQARGGAAARPTMATHETGPLRHRPVGRLHPRQLPGGPPALGDLPGRPRRLLLRGRPPRPHRRDRPGGAPPQHPRCRAQPPRGRPRPAALHDLRAEPRARAHPADLAARVHRHHGRAAADDPVQGEGRRPGDRPGRPLHLPGAHGGRHPALRRRRRCRSATTSASTWSSPASWPSASTTATARRSPSPRRPSPGRRRG